MAYEHDSFFSSDDISINVTNAISIRTATYGHAIFDEENLIPIMAGAAGIIIINIVHSIHAACID